MVSRNELEVLVNRYNAKGYSLMGSGHSRADITLDAEGRMDTVIFNRRAWAPLEAAEYFRRFLAA